ncbi:MAG: glycosyltransferase family 39 protein [Methanobacterium sp.]
MYLWPAYDTYDLLANAALFAGKGIGYSDLLRPPLLPFLTSIYFMFNGLSITPILVVDGFLCIFGSIGLYLFLKERFNPLISFVGSLLYITSPLILVNAAAGYNDIPSVSLGIWALYLTYVGVKRNSKFFYLAFPMAMLAFLTKYNMALLIFPMLLYVLDELEGDKKT